MDSNEKELQFRKIALEELKVRRSRERFWVGTIAIGIITLIVNSAFQNRQLDEKKVVEENKHLSQFVKHIIDKDPEYRHRIAQYFSELAMVEDSRKRWKRYLSITEANIREIHLKQSDLEKARRTINELINELVSKGQDDPEAKRLRNQIAALQGQIDRLRSNIEMIRQGSLITSEEEQRDTPWLKLAREEIGVKEFAGPESNPKIMAYFRAAKASWPKDDSVPWNSAFVAWVYSQLGIEGTNSLGARSWLLWGSPVTKPIVGSIAILSRGTNPPGPDVIDAPGHVGFLIGVDEDEDKVLILGGNQDNSVSVARFPTSRVLGYRWPW
jgi:uncharacterized protein (TIGR02594 family)